MYENSCNYLVEFILKGYNSTLFAYGITVFLILWSKVCHIEIYNEVIRDLLVPNCKETIFAYITYKNIIKELCVEIERFKMQSEGNSKVIIIEKEVKQENIKSALVERRMMRRKRFQIRRRYLQCVMISCNWNRNWLSLSSKILQMHWK